MKLTHMTWSRISTRITESIYFDDYHDATSLGEMENRS